MRKILLTIFTLLALNSFGQNWDDYKFDDNLTIALPENSEIIDTLGQHIVKAVIDNAIIMIQRLPNKGATATNIRDKKELKERYEEFQEGAVKAQAATLIKQRVSEKDGLMMIRFSCKASMGEEKQIRHFLVVFVNENWYTINFWEVETVTNELKADRDRLFASVKFAPGLGLKNQMSSVLEGSRVYRLGLAAGSILASGMFIGVLVAVIIWLTRRNRRTNNAR
jgi:hypothetical protein